jgi:hypothetical protein
MIFASTVSAQASGRVIPIRWRRIAWFPQILNLNPNRNRNRIPGRNLAAAPAPRFRRHWLFSASPLTRLNTATHIKPNRASRQQLAPMRFRPLTIFASNNLRRSFLSPLNQHPGL